MKNLITRVTRSEHVESFHVGFGVVIRPDGQIVERFGESAYVTFARSSMKPLQAMAVLRSGAAEHFGFTDEELAIICASHNGEPIHTELVAGILAKIGLDDSAFDCGAHAPIDKIASDGLVRAGKDPGPIHNNCSGKHSGMLAVTRHLGASVGDYLRPDHPCQQLIYDIVREYTDEEEIFRGLDGCSAPVFFLSIEKLALAFARIAEQDTAEKQRIFRVMNSHPYLVAGRKRLDTELMQQFPGTLISKGGGEAVFAMGVKHGEEVLGLALKVLDGNHRAVGPMAMKMLDHCGLMDDGKFAKLEWFWKPALKNVAGRVYGSYHTDIEED